MRELAAVGMAYLLGSVPFAALAGRLRGVDLRRHGSGNLGATNAIRVLGAAWGVPVLVADVLKGYVGVAYIPRVLSGGPEELALACGVAAAAGHVWPIFLRLRGGKGVATGAGVFLALAPGAVGLALACFVLVLVLSRYVSLASMVAALALPAALLWRGASSRLVAAGLAVAALILLRHRANIARLRAGTENRIRLRRSGREGT